MKERDIETFVRCIYPNIVKNSVQDVDEQAIPDNVDVPERVLDSLDLSVEVYGVESE
jgi:hypothetical protein